MDTENPSPNLEPDGPRFVGWNDAAILDALGNSPQAIRRALMSQRQGTATQPTDWAIYQWVSRGRIASIWRARMIYTALRLGRLTPVEVFRIE